MTPFLDQLIQIIGHANVLTLQDDKAPFEHEWRKRYSGQAQAVIRPGNTQEVAQVVKLCAAQRISIVPQGGNTGLVIGSIPNPHVQHTTQETIAPIILSLQRMNQVRAIDEINNTVTVEAGCVLQTLQQAAQTANRLFPLSLGAEGSCTIGGNLSTNAGGTAVLRYGNTRELCLGLEVVTAEGEIWHGLRGLRKDNTGYDLRDLFIGAEGTLGIITAAVMKLYPQPRAQVTAFAGVRSVNDALKLLTLAQSACGASLTGFELISEFCVSLTTHHFPQQKRPLNEVHAQYVLLEISDSESAEHANAMFESLMQQALTNDIVQDAVVAQSQAQSRALWHLRESITLAQAAEGKNIKHDVSVPISAMGEFVSRTDALLQQHFSGARMVTFGHLGDGNLHYNVSPPTGVAVDEFIAHEAAINRLVHDSVMHFNGSISAEHGIGQLKREEILRYKSPLEIALMKKIKQALDPHNLMNPGKVLM